VVGLLVAPIVVRALLSFLPGAASMDLSADINPRVFLFALTVAGATAVFLVSPLPAGDWAQRPSSSRRNRPLSAPASACAKFWSSGRSRSRWSS
jgi:hypothetical protein